MSFCCPDGIFTPLIIDCCGTIRNLRPNEQLKANIVGSITTAGMQWEGSWLTSTAYIVDDTVTNNSASYVCILAHTSGDTDDEPGVGATTATYWELMSAAGSGSVTPGSVDNALTRADGTGNTTIQGSPIVVADNGSTTITQTSGLETSGAHGNAIEVYDSNAEVYFAVTAFTEDSKNLGVGPFCGTVITTGVNNMMFGYAAGNALTEGSDNVLIGRGAGVAVEDGIRNVFLGSSAGASCVSADENVGIGRTSLLLCTGTGNTAIGYDAGDALTSGTSNTFIGNNSGSTGQLVTATNSIAIGVGVFTTASNTTVIGNSSNTDTFLYGDVILQGSGRIGTGGVTSPAAVFDAEGTTGATEFRLTRVSADTGSPRIRYRKARGTPGSEAAVQSGDIIGTFTFHCYRNGAYQGADSPASCMFFAEVTGAPSGNSVPGDVVFNTTDVGDTANSNSLRISHENGVFIYVRSGGTPTVLPTNAAGFFARESNAQMFAMEEDGTVWQITGVGLSDADGCFHLPVLADAGRPAAGTAGRIFFNSDDGQLNIDDGTNWTLPDGTTT